MRFEKSEQLLHLAMLMQVSTEGVCLNDIQEEFGVGRRTAEPVSYTHLTLPTSDLV